METTNVNLAELIDTSPPNFAIQDALTKCYQHVTYHNEIVASISGGSDSDVLLDLIIRCGGKDKTTFVFFNTGLEYEATKKQIKFLEEKYGIEIKILPPHQAYSAVYAGVRFAVLEQAGQRLCRAFATA